MIILVPGIALGTALAFIQRHTGAMAAGGEGGGLICPSGNYSVVARSTSSIKLINNNMDFFKQVSNTTNVPWQVIVAVSYRESNLDTSRSLSNGEAYCNNRDNTYSGPCNGKMDDAVGAMEHLKDKSPGGWNKDTFDADKIKKALFGYNGAADAYKDQAVKLGFPRDPGYDGSPYVMNNFDDKHLHMGIITRDGGGIDANDARDGAFTVASLLVNGDFDSSGKIISLGGCKSAGDSTASSVCSQKIIEIAQKEIGYQEGPNNSNKYSDINGKAGWCAVFSSWVYKQAGYLNVLDAGPLSLVDDHPRYLKTVKVNGDPSKVKPGDIFWIKLSAPTAGSSGFHSGIIKSINGKEASTIEGNVSNSVGERKRDISQIEEVARPIQCQ